MVSNTVFEQEKSIPHHILNLIKSEPETINSTMPRIASLAPVKYVRTPRSQDAVNINNIYRSKEMVITSLLFK